MTNEELTAAFPECERIKREQVSPFVEQVMNEVESWRDIGWKIKSRCQELWPKPVGVAWEDPLRQEWNHYFYGDWNTGQDDFGRWTDLLEDEYLRRTGEKHTFEEACQIAADEWTRMIFGFHVQDNGDRGDSGCMASILGTLAKDKVINDIDKKTIENFRQLCKDYYLQGCKTQSGYKLKYEPYCDYHPNTPLESMLLKAGVSEGSIDVICPWKTGISVDERDHSVIVRGYQTVRYM